MTYPIILNSPWKSFFFNPTDSTWSPGLSNSNLASGKKAPFTSGTTQHGALNDAFIPYPFYLLLSGW